MQLTEQMVQGVDVWINTPRRPWEACGTSGMKVLVNGGLNLSELDGWWAEAYTPAVGWALGDGLEHGDDPGVDAREAGRLYDLLEGEVVPDFYARDAAGIPLRWVKRMRESMARLTPRYSADRAVREYVQQHYLPAARSYRERSAEKGAEGAALLAWSRRLDSAWPGLVLGPLQVVGGPGVHAFTMGVRLGRVDPDAVRFELFAEGRQGGPPERKDLQREAAPAGSAYALLLRATVPDQRPAGDYSARALPWRPGAAIPLESAHIAWSP
jgi:starch phosphorylase